MTGLAQPDNSDAGNEQFRAHIAANCYRNTLGHDGTMQRTITPDPGHPLTFYAPVATSVGNVVKSTEIAFSRNTTVNPTQVIRVDRSSSTAPNGNEGHLTTSDRAAVGAGVGGGCITIFAVALLLLWRRRIKERKKGLNQDDFHYGKHELDSRPIDRTKGSEELENNEICEMDVQPQPKEMDDVYARYEMESREKYVEMDESYARYEMESKEIHLEKKI
jgi:hypothetical protein